MPDPDAPKGPTHAKPWDKRTRLLPTRTYSGKVVYRRRVRRWTLRDVERVAASVGAEIVATEEPQAEAMGFLAMLKRATLAMLERLLPFLDETIIAVLYDMVHAWLEKVIEGILQNDPWGRNRQDLLRPYIQQLIAQAGIDPKTL